MSLKKTNEIIMALSVPLRATHTSQVIFRRVGKEVMIFKINIKANLKEINKS